MTLNTAGASCRHRWTGAGESTHFRIAPSLVRKVAVEGFDLDPDRVHLPVVCCGPSHPDVERDLAALRGELLTGGAGGRLCAESLATMLVVHLIRRTAAAPSQRGLKGVLARQALRAVEEYIMDNLNADLTLADLAAVIHLSEFHFARLFKASTGMPPHQFVIHQRVERAKQLITEGQLPLVQVAAAVGFASQSHLNRHFKRLVGCTPAEFRN